MVDARFCGPPGSGNGGYVAGLLANVLGETAGALGAPASSAALRAASSSTSRNSRSDVEAVEVTLRRPAPLDKPLDVRATDDGVELIDGDELIAEAFGTTVGVEPPPMPDLDVVLEAAARGEAQRATMQYNDCFVCGATRAEGDGLRIFSGWTDDGCTGCTFEVCEAELGSACRGACRTAGVWTPDASLADGDGAVRPEFVSAALDCPGGFVYIRPEVEVVLGRYAVKQLAPMRAGTRYTVIGWPAGEDGRKLRANSALYDEDGSPVAVALATWITI